MFIALDKLPNQGLRQAIVVVPEKSIWSSFNDELLSKYGFWADWTVQPQWNLCNAPGGDDGRVGAVGKFLASDDKVLVCTHATFRFAVDKFGIEAFDDRLIAVDEFHHVSANPDNKLGAHLGALVARDKVHLVAMTGSYFRGDAEAVRIRTTAIIPRRTVSLRKTLQEAGVIREEGGFLVFNNDYSFSSVSAAAATVIGAAANGRILWKLSDSRTYGEWEANQDGGTTLQSNSGGDR
jgi:hypothetical protein